MRFKNVKRGTLLISKNKKNSYYRWAILSEEILDHHIAKQILCGENCESKLVTNCNISTFLDLYIHIEPK